MVFGLQKLQNDIFCLTEERDYFQTKFLEQVSELKALKDELNAAKKEISRLRQEVMNNNNSLSPSGIGQLVVNSPRNKGLTNNKVGGEKDDDASSLTAEDDDEHLDDADDDDDIVEADRRLSTIDVGGLNDDNAEDDDSGKDIRQSAEKLLQWASYRSSVSAHRSLGGSATPTTDHSSVMSPVSSTKPTLLGHDSGADDLLKDARLVEEDDDDDESGVGSEYSSDETSQDQNKVPTTRAGKLLQKLENVLDGI